MGVTEKMENRYIQLRRRLDAKGYRDVLPVDSVPLVEKIFNELIVTKEEFASTKKKGDYFEKIAKELEDGVAPFKEENVRLIKENSTLRVALLREKESVLEQSAGNSIRVVDLEAENKELKQLINQFVARTRQLETDLRRKTTKILLLQERNLEAQIVGPGGEKLPLPSRKQKMEISGTGQQFCPHCIRIRNFVEYGNPCKEPGTFEYLQIADSRIEALQLQLRHMKRKELELINAITTMKCKVEGREEEIAKLHGIIEVKPGGLPKDSDETGGEGGENLAVALKAAQMQLNILQLRNMQLERKLQTCIVMDRRSKTAAGNAGKLSSKTGVGDYPDYESVKLQEKVETLEAQLSHCCAEKARLKLLLEECENKDKHFNTPKARSPARIPEKLDKAKEAKTKPPPGPGKLSDDDYSWEGEDYHDFDHGKRSTGSTSTRSKQSHDGQGRRTVTRTRESAERPTDADARRAGSKGRSSQPQMTDGNNRKERQESNGSVNRAGQVSQKSSARGQEEGPSRISRENAGQELIILTSSDEFSDEEDNVKMLEIHKVHKNKSDASKILARRREEEQLRTKMKGQLSALKKLGTSSQATIANNKKRRPDIATAEPVSTTSGQARSKLSNVSEAKMAVKFAPIATRPKPSRLVSLARQQPVSSETLSHKSAEIELQPAKEAAQVASQMDNGETETRPAFGDEMMEKLDRTSKQRQKAHQRPEKDVSQKKSSEMEISEEEDGELGNIPQESTAGTVTDRNKNVQPNNVDTYRSEIKRKQDEITSLQEKNLELERRLSRAEPQLPGKPDDENLNGTVKEKAHRAEDMELEIENLKCAIDNLNQENEKMQTELTGKNKSLEELKTQLSKNVDEIEELKGTSVKVPQGRQDIGKNIGRLHVKEDTPENGRDGYDTGSLSGRKSTQTSADAYDVLRKSPRSDTSTSNLLMPPNRLRENILFPESAEGRPSRSDWLSVNSNIETYRKEVRKLRDVLFQKEDEIDTLRKDNQELERRLRSSHIRETMKTPSYSMPTTDQEKQELEKEIGNLRFALKALDKDKDEMRMELDKKDEKLYRLQQESSQNMDELGKLQLRLKNAELHLGRSSESSRDQEREVVLQKRQIISLREDLEQMIRERDDARKEIRHVTQTNAMIEVERRNLNGELESRTRETDDLKRQVQKYVDEVRRIEDLLQRKEEEYDAILEHYRTLTAERTTLERTRSSLERETDSIKQEVRDVLSTNNALRAKLASQDTLTKSYEEEIERLSHQVANLEIQLSNVLDSDKTLQSDAAISQDLCLKLENNLSKLRLELANAESARATTEAGNRELQAHISSLESTIAEERTKYTKLEEMITQLRDKEYALQRSVQDLMAERQEIESRFTTASTKLEIVSQESERYRMRCAQLLTDLEMLQRQLENEKGERDNAVDELRRMQQQLNTSSTNLLLTSALGRSTSPTSTSYKSPQIEFQFSPSSLDTPLGASTSRADAENLDRYRTSTSSFERPPDDLSSK